MNPTKGSKSSRIKPNNPDSVQKRIEPRVMFAALNTQQDRWQRVLNTLSHLEISSQSRLKSGLKGSYGKIDAGEMSETAFIQPVKKAVSSAILSLGSPKLGN